MTKKTYSEKLRDPRWQRKRLEIMERDNFTCLECKSDDKTLNVHHGYYEKGLDPWEYEESTLHTLCEKCHVGRALIEREFHKFLSKLTGTDLIKYLTLSASDQSKTISGFSKNIELMQALFGINKLKEEEN